MIFKFYIDETNIKLCFKMLLFFISSPNNDLQFPFIFYFVISSGNLAHFSLWNIMKETFNFLLDFFVHKYHLGNFSNILSWKSWKSRDNKVCLASYVNYFKDKSNINLQTYIFFLIFNSLQTYFHFQFTQLFREPATHFT